MILLRCTNLFSPNLPHWLQRDYYFISALLGHVDSLWHLNGASGCGGSWRTHRWFAASRARSHRAVSNAGSRCHVRMNGAIVRPRRSVCPLNREPLSGTNQGAGGGGGFGDESGYPPTPPHPGPLFPLPGWLLPSHQVKSQCAGSRPGWESRTRRVQKNKTKQNKKRRKKK